MECKPVGSYEKSGINVLIIGTGFGGLPAALECYRKGHNVRVFERNSGVDFAGDMYFQGISAMGFLKHWPEMQREYERNSLAHAWIETFKHDGDRMFTPHKIGERLHAAGLPDGVAPGSFQMRPLIYNMLRAQVERLGIKIEYGKRVVDYFETAKLGGVVLEDGQTHMADLIVAADGVGSKSQRLVGGPVRARSSGRAMWRAVFPISKLDEKIEAERREEVKKFFSLHDGSEPIVRTFFGPGTYGLTLTKDDTIVWIVNHDVTGSEAETWHHVIDAEEVLAQMDNIPGPTKWSPIIKDLIACTPPGTIVNFELWWRDPQESWSSPEARVVQIGDSAHSFLPSSGSGATQAIEDAISLASCLQAGGADNVPQAVRVHRRLRFVRTACAQKMGFANAELLQKTDWDKVKIDPRKSSPKLPKWIWHHDPEAYAHQNYDASAKAMGAGVRLEDDESMPPNFPPGYKYEPWTIDDIMEDLRNGKEVELGSGDWS